MSKEMTVQELFDGDQSGTLIGGKGGRSSITGEMFSSWTMPGTIGIETEHGTLYLEPDEVIEVE